MDCYLTLARVVDSLFSILTVVLVLASIVFLAYPQARKRLGLGEDFNKNMVITVLSIVITQVFSKAISESETRAKYVELGVGFLSSITPKNPSNESTGLVCPELSIDERALRKWAVSNVRAYSDVPMDKIIEERLICGGLDITLVPDALIDKARAEGKAAMERMDSTP